MMHRTSEGRSHAIAGVFVFLLLGVFAVFSTLLVMVGAQAYRAVQMHSEEHMTGRTLYAYMLNTIRGDDTEGAMEVQQEDGLDVLVIQYDFDGDIYYKRIYCYDGYLRELLNYSGSAFNPTSGEEISPAQSMHVELKDGLVTVEITDDYERVHTVQAALRTER